MKMAIVALSLFTVAALAAMEVKAADKLGDSDSVVVDMDNNMVVVKEEVQTHRHHLYLYPKESPAKEPAKLAKETAKRLFFYAAALVAIEATTLACGYEHGPVCGLLSWLLSSIRTRSAVPTDDDSDGFIGFRFKSHDTPSGTAGSVWISAGLSSLAFSSIAAIMLIFWKLKRPRKADQKDPFST